MTSLKPSKSARKWNFSAIQPFKWSLTTSGPTGTSAPCSYLVRPWHSSCYCSCSTPISSFRTMMRRILIRSRWSSSTQSLSLTSMPYCSSCQWYTRESGSGLLPPRIWSTSRLMFSNFTTHFLLTQSPNFSGEFRRWWQSWSGGASSSICAHSSHSAGWWDSYSSQSKTCRPSSPSSSSLCYLLPMHSSQSKNSLILKRARQEMLCRFMWIMIMRISRGTTSISPNTSVPSACPTHPRSANSTKSSLMITMTSSGSSSSCPRSSTLSCFSILSSLSLVTPSRPFSKRKSLRATRRRFFKCRSSRLVSVSASSCRKKTRIHVSLLHARSWTATWPNMAIARLWTPYPLVKSLLIWKRNS